MTTTPEQEGVEWAPERDDGYDPCDYCNCDLERCELEDDEGTASEPGDDYRTTRMADDA